MASTNTESSQYVSKGNYGSMTSFSGSDIIATITVPGWSTSSGKSGTFVVGTLQTISYSIHRDKYPVRTLGRINPKGYAYGPRTIAGSLIFTVFNKNLVHEIKALLAQTESVSNMTSANRSILETWKYQDASSSYSIMDEMPPFDVTLSFRNEYGQAARMKIIGIVITDEGQTMSIEDMITENTMTYMAHDIVVLNTAEGS